MPRLSSAEWSLLPETLWQLARAKWQVWTRPAQRWMPVGTMPPARGQEIGARSDDHTTVRAIVRVTEGLGRRLPWRSVCLDQALAVHRMLQKRGIPHRFHFGVNRLDDGALEAHAWISAGGEVILGRAGLHRFREINRIDFS